MDAAKDCWSSLVVIIWDAQAATIGASSLLSRLGEVKGKQYDLGMTERSIRYCYLAINHYRQRNDDAVVNEVCHVFWQSEVHLLLMFAITTMSFVDCISTLCVRYTCQYKIDCQLD